MEPLARPGPPMYRAVLPWPEELCRAAPCSGG
jgi:hypothetical protein